MITLFGLLLTLVGIYSLAQLVYLGEQEASKLSKSVTALAIVAILIIIGLNWILVFSISDSVAKAFGR